MQRLGLEPGERHAGAAQMQAPRGAGADSARRAGDQDAASGERHVSSFAFIRSNSSSEIAPFSLRSASLATSSAVEVPAVSRM